jgi:hypothetical protein
MEPPDRPLSHFVCPTDMLGAAHPTAVEVARKAASGPAAANGFPSGSLPPQAATLRRHVRPVLAFVQRQW